ncbi:MAG: deoxyuridine 5'-triphosphate nucleotidohydrolase [Candidatus Lokiarchaeota archaeon]|nr:deoxyuridine 5'-triphosphate nucleotidohydrolase [Candidatus Lokiarchaeota archaeon]
MTVQNSDDVLKCVEDLVDAAKQKAVNGVDITVNKVFRFASKLVIDFDNSKRKNPELTEVPFTAADEKDPFNSYWDLGPGSYMVAYGQKVTIPLDCVGVILPRSTLMAGGVYLASALWDSGYSGYGRGLFLATNPHGIRLYNKARIGQIILLKTAKKLAKGYDGTYQNEKKR